MIRGYDSGVVLREDIIERVRQVYNEIEQLQREMEEREVVIVGRDHGVSAFFPSASANTLWSLALVVRITESCGAKRAK